MSTTKIHVAKTLDYDCLVGTFVESLDHDDLLAYCREYEVDTNFDTTVDDSWPDETDRCLIELTAAMVKAYEKDKADLAGAIVGQLYKAIQHLGGKSDILTTVGSFRDTLDDSEVLQFLQDWNNGVQPVCICSVDETPLRLAPAKGDKT